MSVSSPAPYSTPMRQSYTAILLIAYRLYKVLARQLFPLLLIVLFGGSSNDKGRYLMYLGLGIAILGGIYSIVAFFKYYFYLKGDKLIVQKGVFKKTLLEIPFDRIQSINFEQNLIHRVFNVVRLNMDTAGSAGNELQLSALDHDLATSISDHILKHRASRQSQTTESEHQADQEDYRTKEIIFNLSIGQLLKVGVTENHLRSGAVIIFFFFWIFDSLKEVGMDVEERMEEWMPTAEALAASLIFMAVMAVLFMMAAFTISLIRTVLRYYDLKMYRQGRDGFVIVSGLLNRREQAAKDEKIQLVQWSQNLLQKWGGIYEMRMKQASSVEVNDSKAIQVVGLDDEDIQETQTYLFEDKVGEIQPEHYKRVDAYYRFKKLYYRSLFFQPLLAGLFYFSYHSLFIVASLWYVLSLVGAQLSYMKKSYGVSDHILQINGGTWGRSTTKLFLHKIQNLTLTQTPFQHRRSLGSIILHTASGSVTIPDIAYTRCLWLKNYLLYRVESSQEGWM